MRAYTLIDHTADLGIRVRGKTLEDLFINAGYALFDLLVGTLPPARTKSRELSVSGIDWPDLMVNWLRALFFLWTDDQSVPSAIRITSLVTFELTAHVEVTQFDARHDKIIHDIKAVTYHQIDVKPIFGGWEANIIFDV